MQVGIDETAEWSEAGVTAAIVPEGGTISASKPAVGRRNVVIHAIKTLTHASEEILADNPAYADFLFRQQGRKIANRVERLIIAGTGVDEPMGILASRALLTVAKEDAQTARTIVPANPRKKLAHLLPGSYRTAIWITHTTALPEVMGLDAGIYNPDGASPFGLGTVLGRPLAVREWANPLGTVGDLILVDPTGCLFAVEGPRNDMALGFAFDQGLSSFRVVLGMGGVPLFSAPVPRRAGTETLSHVVVLAERS